MRLTTIKINNYILQNRNIFTTLGGKIVLFFVLKFYNFNEITILRLGGLSAYG